MTNTDVIKKLIGPIRATGDASHDAQRMENLKEMCTVINDLLDEVVEASLSKDNHQFSMKEIGTFAQNFLNDIKD